jgi:hypothetical protein
VHGNAVECRAPLTSLLLKDVIAQIAWSGAIFIGNIEIVIAAPAWCELEDTLGRLHGTPSESSTNLSSCLQLV